MKSKRLGFQRAASEESLRRRRVTRKPFRRILIACEGEETEKRYFEAYVSSLKASGIDVDVCGEECDSAPRSVVDFAIARARSEGHPERGGYNIVFCVFDRDDHETFDEALVTIKNLNGNKRFPTKIVAVPSIPCFEFWLILHFKYVRSPFQPARGKSVGKAVVSELKKLPGFESYEKAISSAQADILVKNVETARSNARRCLLDAEATGEKNPSTCVTDIIDYISEAHDESVKETKKSA